MIREFITGSTSKPVILPLKLTWMVSNLIHLPFDLRLHLSFFNQFLDVQLSLISLHSLLDPKRIFHIQTDL